MDYELEQLCRSIAMLSPGARALDREGALRVLADLQAAQRDGTNSAGNRTNTASRSSSGSAEQRAGDTVGDQRPRPPLRPPCSYRCDAG